MKARARAAAIVDKVGGFLATPLMTVTIDLDALRSALLVTIAAIALLAAVVAAGR